MTKRAVSKVMWVGRATVFLVGLAMIFALVLGAATTALAGTGVGATLDLGKTNTVNAVSRLVGSVAGASLTIDNDSNASSATALDLSVQPGKAPMKVDSQAKVANLNADRLDGQNAPLLMRVEADGDLASNDTIATVAHTANSGYYTIEFVNGRAVAGCVYQATLVNTPGGGEISVHTETQANRLTVITTRNNLVFNDRYDFPFHLVIYC